MDSLLESQWNSSQEHLKNSHRSELKNQYLWRELRKGTKS